MQIKIRFTTTGRVGVKKNNESFFILQNDAFFISGDVFILCKDTFIAVKIGFD